MACWTYVAVSRYRLRHISSVIDKIPENQRAALLAREYSIFPKSGLSAEQWLRSQRQRLVFLAVLALLIAIPRTSKQAPTQDCGSACENETDPHSWTQADREKYTSGCKREAYLRQDDHKPYPSVRSVLSVVRSRRSEHPCLKIREQRIRLWPTTKDSEHYS